MAFTWLDWLIIVLYVLIVIIIGFVLQKQAGKSLVDYFLGGRNLPWYLAGISMVATTFAADTPLAVTELVHAEGIAGNWLWWNFLIGGMLTVFFYSRLWRRAGILTELEFTELRYSGNKAAFLRGFRAVYLGLFMNTLIMAWVSLAFMTILQVLFDLSHGEALTGLAITMLLAGFYSILSGLKGIVTNDAIQFVLAMAGCIVLAIYVIQSPEIGGVAKLKEQLPDGTTNFFPSVTPGGADDAAKMLTLGIGSFVAYLGFQWWSSWYPGSEPGGGGYVAQRMMSTPDEKSAFWATFLFQIAHYCIRPWPWIMVALAVPVLYPALEGDEIRHGFVMAMRDYLPAGWLGLMFVAFTAAYMSTISTQLNWGSSYLVNDLGKRFWKGGTSTDVNWVFISRLITGGLLLIAFLATTVFDTITEVWFFVIEASAGIGLVLLLRWYWWRINAWSEIVAAIAPIVFSLIVKVWFGIDFPDSFFIILALTTLSWITATYVTAPEPTAHLQKFVRRVRPGGRWKPVLQTMDAPPLPSNQSLVKLAAGWLFAVVCGYAMLFLTGSILLLEWQQAAIYGGVFITSLTGLWFAVRNSL